MRKLIFTLSSILSVLTLGACEEPYVPYTPKRDIAYYVINLDKNPERLAKMSHRFEKAHLSFERIPAVLGSLVNREEAQQKGQFSSIPGTPTLRHGELGCYMSHLKSFEKTAKSDNTIAAVFEDDATFSPNLAHKIDDILDVAPIDWDMIYLFCGGSVGKCNPSCLQKTADGRFALLDRHCIAGTVSYLVHPRSAQTILRYAYPIAMPVDFMLRGLIKDKGLRAYCALPNIVGAGNDQSTIEPGRVEQAWRNVLDR